MLQPKDFKISCSAIGQIMTESKGKSRAEKINELILKIQSETEKLANLKEGSKSHENKKAAIDKLFLEMEAAQLLPDFELSETTKTYCQTWIKQKLYDRRKDFSTKHTAKGNAVEDDAIALCSNFYDWPLGTEKNTERKSNEFMEGTCDVIRYEDDTVTDNKCSFDCFTFPLFEVEVPDKGYWWQLQGYAHLYGVKKAELIYCLMDTPEDMLISEAWKVLKYGNYLETDFDEVLEIVRKKHTYSHLPSKLRLKRFCFDAEPEAVEQIKARVSQCRLYIKTILDNL